MRLNSANISAMILEAGSRTEFPKGSRIALGSVRDPSDMLGAFEAALVAFKEKFGRLPHRDRLMFRGSFTTRECVVEICETP